jgi:hypothetical protein
LLCDLSENFVKMARLFWNSEYIDVVLAYGEACGSASRAQRISVRLLVGDLVYSIPIDASEVLRKRVENAATTIRTNNRYAGKSGRIVSWAPCIDNNGGHFVMISDYSDYFMRIFTN